MFFFDALSVCIFLPPSLRFRVTPLHTASLFEPRTSFHRRLLASAFFSVIVGTTFSPSCRPRVCVRFRFVHQVLSSGTRPSSSYLLFCLPLPFLCFCAISFSFWIPTSCLFTFRVAMHHLPESVSRLGLVVCGILFTCSFGSAVFFRTLYFVLGFAYPPSLCTYVRKYFFRTTSGVGVGPGILRISYLRITD